MFALTQACLQPVWKSSTGQWGMHFALINAQCIGVESQLREEQILIGVFAINAHDDHVCVFCRLNILLHEAATVSNTCACSHLRCNTQFYIKSSCHAEPWATAHTLHRGLTLTLYGWITAHKQRLALYTMTDNTFVPVYIPESPFCSSHNLQDDRMSHWG